MAGSHRFDQQRMEQLTKDEGQDGFTNLSSSSMLIAMDTKPIENSEASGQPYLQMNNNSKLMPPICRHKILSRLGNTFVMGSGIQPGDVVMQAIHQSTSTNKNTNGEVNGNLVKAEPLSRPGDTLLATKLSPRIKPEPSSELQRIPEFPALTLATSFHNTEQIDSADGQETFMPDLSPADSSSSGSTIYHDPRGQPEVSPPRDKCAYMRQLEDEYSASELRDKVRSCYRQVKRLRTQGAKRTIEKSCGIDVIVPKFWPVKKIDAEFEQKTGLKSVLKLISDPEKGFSNLAVDLAGELFRRFDRQNWGAPEEEDDESLLRPEDSGGKSTVCKRYATRRRVGATVSTNASISPSTGPSAIANASTTKTRPDIQEDMRPPRRHAIYGPGKIMDGIWLRKNTTISTNKVTNSRIFDPEKEHPPANRLGHNDIEHGTWWPKQICLVRDGGHGCIQGGIYGNVEDGAFSIIVSGTYSDLDKDSGETLLYSAPKPQEGPGSAKQHNTDRTRILRRSLQTQKAVRVIRAASKHSEYAPKVGLRYDGLYRVASEETGKTVKGVALALFKLVRKRNQPDIDWDTPSWEQQQLFDSIKLHY